MIILTQQKGFKHVFIYYYWFVGSCLELSVGGGKVANMVFNITFFH